MCIYLCNISLHVIKVHDEAQVTETRLVLCLLLILVKLMTMLPHPILVINTAMCAVNITTVKLIESKVTGR